MTEEMKARNKRWLEHMKSQNIKWLEYMNSRNLKTVRECPNGHPLTAYIPTNANPDIIVICCPFEDCDYYDYNTFTVPIGTQLAIKVRKD